MRRIVLIIAVSTALLSITAKAQQKVLSNAQMYTPKKSIICYASNDVNHHHVPAKKRLKTNKNPLQVIPQFANNVPRNVQDLVEKGLVPLLSEAFSSTQPVRVAFFWSNTVGEGTLAGASPTTFFRNVPSTMNSPALPLANVWYPVALAEKILDRQLNEPNDADINVTINSLQDWYLNYNNHNGIGNKYDLLSVLLHEIYHGLGFIGGLNVNVNAEGNGFITSNGSIGAYAHQVVNFDGFFIRDFSEGSTELGSALTGGNLFFRIDNNEAKQPKIYVPRTWEPGSSFSHVDEFTFNNTESSLMTPNASRGEVERDGGIAEDMMYDMGWRYTSILHTPATPVENINDPYNLSVRVVSDEGLQDGIVFMHYSSDQFTNTTTVPMTDNGDGTYSSTIPATGAEQIVDYYFSTKDKTGKEYVSPGQAPTYSYRYVFAIDNTNPVIKHTDVAEVKNVDVSFDISADITDFFTGIDTAYVEYRINDGSPSTVGMSLVALDSFSPPVFFAQAPLPTGLTENDKIEYRITAIDKSMANNTSTYPSDGTYITVPVTTVSASVDQYYNSFAEQEADFVLDGFTQERLDAWGSAALHTAHPYPAAGEGNSLNFTADLQIPIRIAEVDPLIIFEEVVLVENGDDGVPFGATEFWDYVIVEGKKLGTSDWLPFLDGYDCRANRVWLANYTSSIPAGTQNSNAVGTESMLRKRTIDMTANGNFKAGDEVLIRFRMLSDPFAAGWGWAIENLSIQDPSTSVEDYVLESGYSITPNPASDKVTISLALEQSSPATQVSVIDILGKTLISTPLRSKSKTIQKDLDISSLPDGIYFVQIAFNDQDVITQRIIKTK